MTQEKKKEIALTEFIRKRPEVGTLIREGKEIFYTMIEGKDDRVCKEFHSAAHAFHWLGYVEENGYHFKPFFPVPLKTDC
tara:strand:+ start:87 stop:326 length:240 start_codon:yes stop_codon:yes gene_type:complete